MSGRTCFLPGEVEISLPEVHFQSMTFFGKVSFEPDGCITSYVLVCEMSRGLKFTSPLAETSTSSDATMDLMVNKRLSYCFGSPVHVILHQARL